MSDLGRKREREMRLTQWLEELRHDVTFAIRQMKTSPGFTIVAAITLALGIGVNSAMFALADATFLRPFPFGAPADRLVMLWEQRANGFTSMASPIEFRDWNEHSRSFESMASFATGPRTMRGLDGTLEQVQGLTVSAKFFDVLGVSPIVGRTFVPADASAAPTVVVIAEGFWRRRYGADPTLVGRDIVVDGQSLTVVGIMPADFQIAAPFSRGGAAAGDPGVLWILASQTWGLSGRGGIGQIGHYVHVIARLKPGVSVEAAQSEMTPIAAESGRQFPDGARQHGVLLEPLRPALTGPELRLTSGLLLGVVGFVLLMCCANVANLLMSRTTARARELAVRSALGAGRRRIVVQLLTESLVLAGIGGVLGVAIGAAILERRAKPVASRVAAGRRDSEVRCSRHGVLRRDGIAGRCPLRSRAGLAIDSRVARAGHRGRWPDNAPGWFLPWPPRRRRSCRRCARPQWGRAPFAHLDHAREREPRLSGSGRADDGGPPADADRKRHQSGTALRTACAGSTGPHSARSNRSRGSEMWRGAARCRSMASGPCSPSASLAIPPRETE